MPMTPNQSTHLLRWTLLLGASLLAACGGGGSQPPASLGGKVYGLLPGTQLGIEENGSRIIVTTPSYQAGVPQLFAIERGYELGTSYSLAIYRQPLNQLCRITRNATGVLNVSQNDVRVDCHRTVFNDTGIRSTDPQVNASPALAPDALVGRDAEVDRLTKVGAGAFGFDYTKICRSGDAVAASGTCPAGTFFSAPNAWACTRDNVTGLVWQIRDLGDFDPLVSAPPDGFCGKSGWRSPKTRELLSLVHSGKQSVVDPAIDLDYFPGTPAEAFRADEVYPDGDGAAWIVHFGQRGASVRSAAGATLKQRWVASRSPSPLADTASADYVRIDAGPSDVVVEMPSELAWLVPKSAPAALDWAAAIARVAAANDAMAGGYSDWRLPNRNELEALVQRGPAASVPALAPGIVGSDPAGFRKTFWTASPGMGDPQAQAWLINFEYGDLSLGLKSGTAAVILVRNKASGPQP
jgi:hypothetical protein